MWSFKQWRARPEVEGPARPEELSQLTGSQLELVRLLRHRPGLSVSQVADELNLAPNTVSTLVRQLVDAGLVVRGCQQAERRVAGSTWWTTWARRWAPFVTAAWGCSSRPCTPCRSSTSRG
jgi:DNA-binding CsgD family transcriptional regulator